MSVVKISNFMKMLHFKILQHRPEIHEQICEQKSLMITVKRQTAEWRLADWTFQKIYDYAASALLFISLDYIPSECFE